MNHWDDKLRLEVINLITFRLITELQVLLKTTSYHISSGTREWDKTKLYFISRRALTLNDKCQVKWCHMSSSSNITKENDCVVREGVLVRVHLQFNTWPLSIEVIKLIMWLWRKESKQSPTHFIAMLQTNNIMPNVSVVRWNVPLKTHKMKILQENNVLKILIVASITLWTFKIVGEFLWEAWFSRC